MAETANNREHYRVGDLSVDTGARRVTRAGRKIRLAGLSFDVLLELVRAAPDVVTIDRLMDRVWPRRVVNPETVSKRITLLREALGDDSHDPRYIAVERGRGYRWLAPVEPQWRGTVGNPERGAAESAATPTRSIAAMPLRVRSPAYDLYIRGKVKVGGENPADTDEAIRLLEAAVDLDPLFAEAFAHLARAYNTRAFKFSSPLAAMPFQNRAEIALQKAFDLDPDLAEAHFACGLIVWTSAKRFPHEHAIRSFKRSLELDPGADETHHQLSLVLAHIGLLDDAQAHVRTAVDINPNNTMARFRVAAYTAWQCRFDEALAILKTVPSDVCPLLIDRIRAEVLVQLGRIEDARTIVDEYLDRHPADEGGSFTGMKALLLAKQGRSWEADAAIAQATAIGKGFGHFHHTAYNIASACAALDRPDEAVGWLEAAADDGFPCYPYFEMDPNLERIRGHPRFTALMSSLQRRWEGFRKIV